MFRLPMFCGLGILFLSLLVSTGASQDGKKDKDDPKKGKAVTGAVPAGWGKALKLTKDQTKKIQTIDAEYKTKINELKDKIEALKEQAKIEMAKQLTDDQKVALAKLAGLDAPKDKKDGDKDKKKDDDKDKK